jgi:gliding motility-associated-like protein
VLLCKNFHTNYQWKCKKFAWKLFIQLPVIFLFNVSNAQNCPENIDFEEGNFKGWTCYTGFTSAVGSGNIISLNPAPGPVYNKHIIYNANSNLRDVYGGFPVACPNGSGHSVKLGSTEAGGQAEGISYEFTIPANDNSYTLTYYYAVVFQAPHHQPNEQPRMETEVTNVTDNKVISCASFSFIAVGSSIPGFQVSNLSDTIDVLYKNWSPVSVDLSGNAGKTIRLFFKTADCTFRRHFGYAYIDVNTECNGNFVGATFCPDDTLVNIVAPAGYQSYTWYDSSVRKVLGTNQTLTILPPVSGTTLAVKLEPYAGYGCTKTLFSRVIDSLTVTAHAGKDALLCNYDTMQIGSTPIPGLSYRWSPEEGINDAFIANPFIVATNTNTANYVVTTSNSGGGCRTTDTIQIVSSIVDTSLRLFGKDAYCFGHGDSSILQVKPTHGIEWFKDDVPIDGNVNQRSLRINTSGTYFAVLTDLKGCTVSTRKKPVVVDYDKAGITYPLKYAIENLPLELTARPIGQTAVWSPAASLDNTETFTPVFNSNREQMYSIEIISRGGCVTTDQQLVKIVKHPEIYVPTGFTPNNDGRNDYLHPIVRGVANIKMFRIFNRAGQILFQGNTELPGWDGTYRGWPQQAQTVVWTIECFGLDGITYSQKGYAVLIR